MRIKFLDIVILLLITLSLFSYFLQYGTYEQKERLEYSGSQIFKAVKDFENYTSKGFAYHVTVTGRVNMDDSPVEITGIVTETGRGNFVLKTPQGNQYTVGGVMSYEEDIAAKTMVMTVENKSTVFYEATPVETTSFEALYSYVTETSSFMEYKGIYDIAISGEFTIIPGEEAFAPRINDTLTHHIIACKGIHLDGHTLTLVQCSIDELQSLAALLSSEKIYTGDFWVVIRTEEEIEELEKYAIKREDDDTPAIYKDSIHIRL